MKHVIQFSGGLASAEVARIIIDMYGKEHVILMFHDTRVEHPSNAKFKTDVCNFLGVEYVEISYSLDLWDLIVKQRALPSLWIPFCTRILKQEQGLKFLKTLKDKYILYNGFGVHEGRRTSGSIKECSKRGIVVKSPLQEYNISDLEVMRIIRDEWKIEIPPMYNQGFPHNNCIICYKSGVSHFRRVWQYYPEEFEKAIWAEKKVSQITQKNHTTFKRKRKNKNTGLQETILVSLPEFVNEWKEQPFIKPKPYKPHMDIWEQRDLFSEEIYV
jgi:3'-phosphoadenosine 5'-phosphosulfate sulfotransferase (PAPS reductase)/FAD synthetase